MLCSSKSSSGEYWFRDYFKSIKVVVKKYNKMFEFFFIRKNKKIILKNKNTFELKQRGEEEPLIINVMFSGLNKTQTKLLETFSHFIDSFQNKHTKG